MKNSRTTWVVLVIVSLLMAACNTLQPSVRDDVAVASQSVQELFPIVPLPAVNTAMRDETPALWFVQFTAPPRAKGGAAATLRNERAVFAREAAAERIRYNQRLNFGSLFNGISVAARPSEAAKLARMPGVTAVYPVLEVDAPEPEFGTVPDMGTALGMTGADVAQNELGLTGKGVKVAIIDTGMDRGHPDFGNRIVAGWDFVGDDFGTTRVPQPSENYDDCNGHGTHVAGIVGAQAASADGVTGVAPEVSFGAYKVFGCTGSTTSDIIVAALERAYEDGMDVVNMSLGAAFQSWPQYPSAQASDNLVDRGVVVVASIGNSGASGVYAAGAPGVGRKVIGVASFDNVASSTDAFRLSDDTLVGYRPLSTTPAPEMGSTTPEIVYAGRGCTSLGDIVSGVSGLVAMLTRGDCTFNEKYQAAVAAGAVGVVIENNLSGGFAGGGVEGVGSVFGVGISREAGAHIKSLSAPTITWTGESLTEQNPTGNLLSSFSSYGLTAELDLKPDLGAPGGLIRSTYPRFKSNGYAVLSGTSMSAPHVAGAVALLLEAHPNTPTETVRDLLQNSAQPRPWSLNPNIGFLDSVHRQGAGMINIPNTVTSTVAVTPAKLALGESQSGPFSTTLTLRNTGRRPVTYTVSNAANTIATAGNTYTPRYFGSGADVAFSSNSVRVPAGGSATVSVTITANSRLPDRAVYGGYLVFTPAKGSIGQTVRVPYSGFKGDYQSITVLNPTEHGFPWLATLEGGSYVKEDRRLILKEGDVAYVLAHFSHQSRVVRMEIVPEGTLQSDIDTTVSEYEYFGRNSTSTSFFAFAWDGTATRDGNSVKLPKGDYRLKLEVLKALGDPNNPDHIETWLSPPISIVGRR